MGVRLILVRHGQCQSNLSPWQPGTPYRDEDDQLTALGLEQASRAARELASFGLRDGFRIVSSPHTRAHQTARVIMGVLDREAGLLLDADLVEKEEFESFHDTLLRARRAISAAQPTGGDLVCITHGHVIQSIVADALGLVADSCQRLHPVNCAISVILGTQLISYNQVHHLREFPHGALYLTDLD
jgi:broad specificity phosphatase PhoE